MTIWTLILISLLTIAKSVDHDRLLRIANSVDPDQTVPENNSVDFDLDETAENGK